MRLSIWSNFKIIPNPILLIWESNNTCNSRCRYCDVWKLSIKDDELLRTSEIKNLIDEAAKLGLFAFSISGGGEPLLRPDIFEIINYGKKKGLYVVLTTNGLSISTKNVREILKADMVTVSIDNVNEKLNDFNRGVKGGFKRAMEGIQLLRKYNRNSYLCVQSVIDQYNWRDIGRINEFFYPKGFDTIFQPIYNQFFDIPRREWNKKIKNLKFHNVITKYLLRGFLKKFPDIAKGKATFKCLAGSYAFVISPNGKLWICHLNKQYSADLRKVPLSISWKNMRKIRINASKKIRGCICGDTAIVPPSIFLAK